jgi:hypothetical protein
MHALRVLAAGGMALLLACGSSGSTPDRGSGGSGGDGTGGAQPHLDAATDAPRTGGTGGSGGADAGPRPDARPLGVGGQLGSGDGVLCRAPE